MPKQAKLPEVTAPEPPEVTPEAKAPAEAQIYCPQSSEAQIHCLAELRGTLEEVD